MNRSMKTTGWLSGLLAILAMSMGSAMAQDANRSAGQVIDDAAITSKVKAELIKDPATKASDINVETRNGVVQLNGFVDSAAARSRADSIAKSIKGVNDVRNNLELQGQRTAGATVDDAAITAKVKSALIANPLTKAHQIKVETSKGTVQLSGFVDSAEAKMEAARVAQTVAGVGAVENNIDLK